MSEEAPSGLASLPPDDLGASLWTQLNGKGGAAGRRWVGNQRPRSEVPVHQWLKVGALVE